MYININFLKFWKDSNLLCRHFSYFWYIKKALQLTCIFTFNGPSHRERKCRAILCTECSLYHVLNNTAISRNVYRFNRVLWPDWRWWGINVELKMQIKCCSVHHLVELWKFYKFLRKPNNFLVMYKNIPRFKI
jgi:hypothetical protein